MIKQLLLSAAITVAFSGLKSQVYFDVDQSVKMTAEVEREPATITVNWIQDPRTISYDLYRREYGSEGWGPRIGNFPATIIRYVDTDVEPGKLYEYKVEKFVEGVEGYGYVLSGIEMPAVHQAGELLIVLTARTLEEVTTELEAYRTVLETDGWPNRLLVVGHNDPVSRIKADIVAAHEQDDFSAVLVLGDVPVPHSGDINPDAHNDHKGAWSADIYYGDLDGVWTDTLVNNTTAATPGNHNVPGDENWDQSFLPSDVEVAVGRVDFSDMPVFEADEFALLRTYLGKDIAFRTKQFTVTRQAAMRNTNPWIGALGQNGIRNFSPLVGPENIRYDEWEAVLEEYFLWYYGSGGGSQTAAVQLGDSNFYANRSFFATFTAWFGSYFGDYDFENNFMRAVLGSGTTLTAVWAGAPHWHFHSMGMGFPMSHATTVTQNNDTIYTADFFPRGVHTNLLGDPTLKAYIVAPPTDLALTQVQGFVELAWDAPEEPVDRYYVYRQTDSDATYTLIDSTATGETSYRDACPALGEEYRYLVRAAILKVTPSGSFYNLSSGTAASITSTLDYTVLADFRVEINDTIATLTSTSVNAELLTWLLPDGTSLNTARVDYVLEATTAGTVRLIAENACSSDTVSQELIYTSLRDVVAPGIKVYPNPAKRWVTIESDTPPEAIAVLVSGRWEQLALWAGGKFDVSRLPPGVHFFRIQTRGGLQFFRLLVL